MLQGVWDPPGSGMEPVSPALAGGFFTTEPPGKLWTAHFKMVNCMLWSFYFSGRVEEDEKRKEERERNEGRKEDQQ